MNFSVSPLFIDLAIFVFLLIYVYLKFQKGFIKNLFDLLGFIFSFFIAIKFYQFPSDLIQTHLDLPRGISQTFGFIIMGIIAEVFFSIVILLVDYYVGITLKNPRINKILGIIPSLISGIILFSFILITATILPIRPDIKESIVTSYIGGYLTDKTFALEDQLKKIFGGAIQDSLNFLTVKPQSSESIDIKFKTTKVLIDTTSEEEMLTLINTERQKLGIKVLIEDILLQKVARLHCQDMFEKGYFSHNTPDGTTPFDRISNVNISYTYAGENLAYAPTVTIAHAGLMKSTGHRENILSDKFGKVGIGVISAGIYGKMFCQEFRD